MENIFNMFFYITDTERGLCSRFQCDCIFSNGRAGKNGVVNIGAYAMRLTYDANILEYSSGADGGGGGTLQFYNDYVNSTSKSYTITFQTKAAGTSALSLDTISVPCDTEANDMTVKSSGGSVTVSAPVEASSNNNLAALNVAFVYSDGRTESAALSPAFSADITSYNLSAGEDVARLSLDATAADGKAAVQVSGTRMDPGSNNYCNSRKRSSKKICDLYRKGSAFYHRGSNNC